MPFQFRLETILRLRDSEEGQLRDQLAILNAAVTQSEAEIVRLGGVREDHLEVIDGHRSVPSPDLDKIRQDGLYLERLNADINSTKPIARRAAQRRRRETRGTRQQAQGTQNPEKA